MAAANGWVTAVATMVRAREPRRTPVPSPSALQATPSHPNTCSDTFLERLKAARLAKGLPPPATVGLGLQEQLVGAVPVAEHDVPLQCVCLPDDLLEAPGLEAR